MTAKMNPDGVRRIGQTRQPRTAQSRHGILRPAAEGKQFELQRLEPGEDLRYLIDRHWSVRWNLIGRDPFQQETLPHPCVNLAIQGGKAHIYGVGTKRFTVMLEGRGEVVGTKFRPGTFGAFLNAPVATLTGRAIPLADAFGRSVARTLERDALNAKDWRARLALLDVFLRSRLPTLSEEALLARAATELVLSTYDITTVEALAQRCAVSVRTLQRLFRWHVGVSPKWVIRRARIQEPARKLRAAVVWSGHRSPMSSATSTSRI